VESEFLEIRKVMVVRVFVAGGSGALGRRLGPHRMFPLVGGPGFKEELA